MNRSFYNGVVGIKTHQVGIDVVANNISNVNTTGYKETRAEFGTIFSQALNGNYGSPTANDVGLGSTASTTKINLNQGALVNTDNTFDLALDGEGWFGVKDQTGSMYYTRVGTFSKDANGDLTNAYGLYLMGTISDNITQTTLPEDKMKNFSSTDYQNLTAYEIKDTGELSLDSIENQQKINLPDILYVPPVPTTEVSYRANLDPEVITKPDAQTGEMVEVPNVEHFSTSIISPEGDRDTLDMTFTKRVPQEQSGTTWDANIKILKDYGEYDPKITYDPDKFVVYEDDQKVYQIVDEQVGTLAFNSSGALLSNSIPTLSNGGVPLELNLGTPLTPDIKNSGYDGITSLKGGATNHSATSNGKVEGYLTGYDVGINGDILANFDNGSSIPIAKIGVYHFQNDEGLQATTGSLFKESANSGKPIFYQDENGNYFNNTKVLNYKLEQSNVSLSNALTELIVMQRAYDANAKSITTSDQMIQKAINMKT